ILTFIQKPLSMKLKSIFLMTCLMLFISACKSEKKEAENQDSMEQEAEATTVEVATKTITISPLTDSPAYADAALMHPGDKTMTIAEAGEFNFTFDIENYELGSQTESPNAAKLANSGKGQHIHFILNNQPYSAHYEAEFKKEIPAGVHHLVAFLSRSYHESVKNDNSMVVRKLVVGDNPTDSIGIVLDSPTLIYSRPKGTYAGADTENLLLDFFVLNTELSESGNKVKATINGEEFMITEWVPQVINGLEMGEVSIKLELIDANGNQVPGPFNTVERTVTLTE
ncbi:MAG: hypothetical protein AAGH46_11110, partial [Bacteroidota bacterium]